MHYRYILYLLIFNVVVNNHSLYSQGSNITPCDAIDLNTEPCQNIDQIPSLVYANNLCNTKDNVFYKYTMTTDKASLDIRCKNDSSNAFLIHVYSLVDSCSGELILLNEFKLIGTLKDTLRSFGLENGTTYYIGIIKLSPKSNLSFCIGESPVANACATNFYRRAAITIDGLVPGQKKCINGCNTDMTPQQTHIAGAYTYEHNAPAAWYKFTTIGFNWVRLEASSDQMRNVAVSIYTDCDSIIAINAYEMTLEPNRTYYVAVYDLTGGTGEFKLCVTPVNSKNECLIQYPLNVIRTNMGSPLNGPYKPCETVTLEYRVFTLPNNFLEWAHSIVPVFSPCFEKDPAQEPDNAIIPPSSDTFQWNWELPGTIFWKPTTIHDMNVGIDTVTDALCYLNENGCIPMTGGGDCSTSGTQMPGAWVVRTYSAICDSDLPNLSWGYNRNNQAVFSFDVQIPCDAASSNCNDYWVRVISFTDGQTGGWTYMGCTGQMFSTKRLDVISCIPPSLTIKDDTICSGSTLEKIFPGGDTIAYVIWSADSLAKVMGAQDGRGGVMTQQLINNTDDSRLAGYTLTPIGIDSCVGNSIKYNILVHPQVTTNAGDVIIACNDSIRLNGESNGYITWSTTGDGIFSYIHDKKATYHLGANDKARDSVILIMSAEKSDNPAGCRTAIDSVTISFGELELGHEIPFDSCDPVICVTVLQGTGDTYTYHWETGQTTPCVHPGIDQTEYSVTVTNSSGCTKEYSFGVNQIPDRWSYTYNSFKADFNQSNGRIEVNFTGNIPVNYEWKDESGAVISHSANLDSIPAGNYYLVVTDRAGCTLEIGPIEVEQTVKTKRLIDAFYHIYPNPANERINIICQNGDKLPVKATFINAAGVSATKIVSQIDSNSGYVDCADINPGFYTLRLNQGDSIYTTKLLIIR